MSYELQIWRLYLLVQRRRWERRTWTSWVVLGYDRTHKDMEPLQTNYLLDWAVERLRVASIRRKQRCQTRR